MAYWDYCIRTLKSSQALALLWVVDSSGSSPGKAGAKMAIALDGTRFGTIGGGQIEHQLAEQALALLAQDNCPRLFKMQHHGGSGQVCGGTQTVLFYSCALDDLATLQAIQHACIHKQAMQLSMTPQGLTLNKVLAHSALMQFSDLQESGWNYQEIIGMAYSAYIIGGGHVSLALSQVLALLDFEITVIDQRSEVATMQANTFADQKIIAPYTDIARHVNEGLQSYVFIMTHSHLTDQQVLAELFSKQLAYIGVLGSQRKIAVIRTQLTEIISPEYWQTIHAPIGLDIESQTPMEIAMSIGAEVIRVRNAKKE